MIIRQGEKYRFIDRSICFVEEIKINGLNDSVDILLDFPAEKIENRVRVLNTKVRDLEEYSKSFKEL
jgi:hypothetical protein